jgi:hypothetical protein
MNVWERISTIPYIKNLKNLIPQVIMPTISSRYPYSCPGVRSFKRATFAVKLQASVYSHKDL